MEHNEQLMKLIKELIDLLRNQQEQKNEVKKEEVIKDFKECTLGEKFILYLLENKKIKVSENLIEDAEGFIYNNSVLNFLIIEKPNILDDLNELLNSLYEVDINKLRIATKM